MKEPTPRAIDSSNTWWLRSRLLLTVLLVVAWVLWSGMFKPLLLVLGFFSCVLALYVVTRMGHFETQIFTPSYNLRILGYWLWLLREVVKSSIEVAQVVLSRELRVNPLVIELNVDAFDQNDQALIGNSITLTPGTLTIDIDDGRLLAHALTSDGAASLRDGEIEKRVAALRGD